jgi:hypothetical protein
MKRLIKKNKYYDTKEVFWETIEVFINPSSTEIIDIKRTDGDIRGLWYYDGTVYAWPSGFYHRVMKDKFMKLDFQQPHFYTDGKEWIKFHLDGCAIDSKQLQNAILLNKGILSNLVNIDSAIIASVSKSMNLKDFLETQEFEEAWI